jgi:hypothetical protein
MKPPHHTLAALALLICFSGLHAETRTFIDQTGRALEGELVSVSGTMVTIKRISDGQTFTVPATTFSKADQAYFVGKGGAAAPAAASAASTSPTVGSTSASTSPMRVEAKVYPNKNDRPTNNIFDDRNVRIGFRVDVRNGEQQRPFTGGKATMIAFAKDLQDGSQSKVISREEFDVSLEPHKTLSHDTKEAKLTYDNVGYKHGWKYSGYIFVLKDSSGKTVAVVGSSATVEKFADDALKLNVEQLFDKNFKAITAQ